RAVHAVASDADDGGLLRGCILLSLTHTESNADGRSLCDLERPWHRADFRDRVFSSRAEARPGGADRHSLDHSRRFDRESFFAIRFALSQYAIPDAFPFPHGSASRFICSPPAIAGIARRRAR